MTTRSRRKAAAGQAGFTLIEVMVVLVILAILASFAVPRLMDRPDAARLVKARADIRTLVSALNLYKLDNLDYPGAEQGLKALMGGNGTAPGTPTPASGRRAYLDQMPKDPWGRDYQYLRPGVHGEFDVFTLGADGLPGGADMDADIGNWNLDG